MSRDALGSRPWISWLPLLMGLLMWTAAQGFLVSTTVYERPLPPEPDDTLTYVLKTKQMEQCPRQDCPALKDLYKQFTTPPQTAEEQAERSLAWSRVFPIYHPLFSVILLGVKQFGLNLMDSYKFVWAVGPVFFGLAFAYLLTVLWGPPAAGIALTLLAFTVFPDTGLHHVEPSNLTMAIGCIVWARVISRRGDAPWTLIIGAIILVTMHPIGRLYAVIAIFTALVVSGLKLRPRVWAALCLTGVVVGLALMSSRFIHIPGLVGVAFGPQGNSAFSLLINQVQGTLASFCEMCVQIVAFEGGLFGSLPLFIVVATIGYVASPPQARRISVRVTLLYAFFVILAVGTVSTHPGDIVLRMWIPFPVILAGAVGYAIWYSLDETVMLLRSTVGSGSTLRVLTLHNGWPLVILALGLGLSCQKIFLGAEQLYAFKAHLLVREPLKLCASQTEKLLAQAQSQDRVLYTSIIVMPYYFIHGAMQLGAVYYHPAFRGIAAVDKLLNNPDLRFAALYNPMVYHPSFEGGREDDTWWVSIPAFRFSPLNKPFTAQPVSRDGVIEASDFKWIDVRPSLVGVPQKIKIALSNRGKASRLRIIPMSTKGELLTAAEVKLPIPEQWEGEKEVDFSAVPDFGGFRLSFPPIERPYAIEKLAFGDDEHRWPWRYKTSLTFQPSEAGSDPITIAFDAAAMLPEPLKRRNITVLDDCGSSVLLKIDQ